MPEIWTVSLQPLILISGVGLLLLSTIARFGQLDSELKNLAVDNAVSMTMARNILNRAKRYRLALCALYAAIIVLCTSSLGGAVLSFLVEWAVMFVIVTTCFAIVLVVVAMISLYRDSMDMADHLTRQLKHLSPNEETNK